MHLHHIIYFSRATTSQVDLSALEQTSRRNNSALGISGLLFFTGTHFLQVLEGERSKISRTMERIFRDPRHEEVVIALAEDIDERCFTDGPLAIVSRDDKYQHIIRPYFVDGVFEPRRLGAGEIWDICVSVADVATNRDAEARRASGCG